MTEGRYSYDEIMEKYTVESTVGEFADGIMVGFKDGWYYFFRRYKGKHPVTNHKNIPNLTNKVRHYVFIKKFRNYGSQYRV